MSEIRNLTRNGETFYPLTVAEAVIGLKDNAPGFKYSLNSQTRQSSYNVDYYEHSGYLNASGIFFDNNYHCLCTYPIGCKQGDVFLYKGTGRSAAVSALLFDNENNIVGSKQIQSLNNYSEITIDINCSFVVFSSFNGVGGEITLDVKSPSCYNLKDKTNIIPLHRQASFYKTSQQYLIRYDKTVVNGKYLISGGNYYTANDYSVCRSELNELVSNLYLSDCFVPTNEKVIAAFYDQNNNFISDYKLDNLTEDISVNPISFVIIPPKNTYYVEWSISNNNIDRSFIAGSWAGDLMPRDMIYPSVTQDDNLLSSLAIIPNTYFMGYTWIRVSSSTYSTTGLIKCKQNTSYITNLNCRLIAYFDSQLNGLRTVDEFVNNEVFTTPDSASYMRIAFYNDSYNYKQSILNEGTTLLEYCIPDRLSEKLSLDVLSNKKWVAVGDSFTHGDFTGLSGGFTFTSGVHKGQLKVYPFFIGRRNPSMIILNQAQNGLQLKYYVENSMYTNIPTDTDILTIKLGINDSHNSVPIGTINDTLEDQTFYGYWNTLMNWLTNNRPLIKIGLIATNGCGNVEYSDATEAIAIKWGVRCLNEATGSDVPFFYRQDFKQVDSNRRTVLSNLYKVSNTNGHPNVIAHEFESTFIENFLRSL